MRFFNRKNAPVLAGYLYGLACIILLDGIMIAQKEEIVENKFSMIISIPALFSTLGLFLLILISPQEIRDGNARSQIALFVAWLTLLGSALAALCIAFFLFQGQQTRSRSTPGVALVINTAIVPLSGSILWWSRDQIEDNDF